MKSYFTILGSLNKWTDFNTVLINTQNFRLDWRASYPPTRTINLSDPPTPRDYKRVSRDLDGLAGIERLTSAKFKLLWDKDNRMLSEQIRALSDERKLSDGEDHLARLIRRCIDCSRVRRIELEQLGQGKSGASVFLLHVENKRGADAEVKSNEFVLKLCRAGEVWKLESEVQGHIRANKGLGHPGYKEHMPALKEAHAPSGGLERPEKTEQPNRHIVWSGHWYAVHYDFLGGDKFGKFIDLETALVASASELERKMAGTDFAVEAAKMNKVRQARARVVEAILHWLCNSWYANSETGLVRREKRVLWDLGDAPDQEYVVMPPYKLTGRSKGWIQSFLNGQEAEMGTRFFTDWVKNRQKVFRLISEGPSAVVQLGKLGKPLPVLLSHVHGDLNANNILLWLKHKHPFLIDFPCYQDAGHALQDFARLEVEIKFALLDRQRDSPEGRLKAFEHTYSQMLIWQEMEDHLLNRWDEKVPRWRSKGYPGNVQLCYELVQVVRRKALEVQQNGLCPGPAASDFLTEYWPALLYHTVRAIGYPSLSVFKRLLAVYSAGSILTKLNCFTDLD
jgi:hypothetical protein